MWSECFLASHDSCMVVTTYLMDDGWSGWHHRVGRGECFYAASRAVQQNSQTGLSTRKDYLVRYFVLRTTPYCRETFLDSNILFSLITLQRYLGIRVMYIYSHHQPTDTKLNIFHATLKCV